MVAGTFDCTFVVPWRRDENVRRAYRHGARQETLTMADGKAVKGEEASHAMRAVGTQYRIGRSRGGATPLPAGADPANPPNRRRYRVKSRVKAVPKQRDRNEIASTTAKQQTNL
ncbi:hypothetical protein MB84_26240 [Pandoraea oxalativorans]|uniref:Uncharacterized protein n=1 Tax=Pandoraea oxalativorans TaxID=573737 RepID=A0A0G3IH73_9BURK|nr:hypothetical protein MB84_26240 [Pandoraea oxalativorans]